MSIRKPLATAIAALSLAGAGNAAAGDPQWIDVLSYSFGSSQAAAGAVGASETITVGGARTESVGATPADRDVQLKGQKILQNAPGAQPGAGSARDPGWIDVLHYNWGSQQSPGGGNRTASVPLPAARPGGGEIEIDSFSRGPSTAGSPSLARRAPITLHSYDLDAPPSDPRTSTAKYEDVKLGVGAGMDAGRSPSAPDWAKEQEIRSSKDVVAKPDGALLPALQKVREAAARMSSDAPPPAPVLKAETPAVQKYMEFKLREVLISGVIQNGNHAPSVPTPMTAPQRPPVPDGTSSTLMVGERVLRGAVPAAPGVRR